MTNEEAKIEYEYLKREREQAEAFLTRTEDIFNTLKARVDVDQSPAQAAASAEPVAQADGDPVKEYCSCNAHGGPHEHTEKGIEAR